MEWGWNPDTFAALATAAATILATAAALLAVLDLRGRRASEQQSQARQVAAWGAHEWRPSGDNPDHPFVPHVYLVNRSDLPVHDIRLVVTFADGTSETMRDHTLAPNDTRKSMYARVDNGSAYTDGPPRVTSLAFTDHAGVRWLRRQAGGLAESRTPVD